MAWPPKIPPGSKAMREFWAALVKRITETTPIEGIGISTSQAPNGISINSGARPGSGGGALAAHPWLSEITTDDSDNLIVSVGEGRIFPSLDNPTALDFAAMGLTFPAYTGTVEAGTKVMLRIDYDSADLGNILAAGVLCYIETSTAAWSAIDLQEWEEDAESEDYDKQTISRIPICEVVASGDSLAIRQLARNDWWMVDTFFGARIADWPSAL